MTTKYPTYKYEQSLMDIGHKNIAGIDEAGRGCGAGPVVAAAVRIPSFSVSLLEGEVRDSKKLSKKKRLAACQKIITLCDVGVGLINNDIIDEINILESTKLAMSLALRDLKIVNYVLIDGNFSINALDMDQESIIKGDDTVLSIAAASIIAKETRDAAMLKMHETFPIYGWDKNKGYLTKEHIKAIQTYGPSVYHRMSFRKVGR